MITESAHAQPSSAVKDEKEKSWEENEGKVSVGKQGRRELEKGKMRDLEKIKKGRN